jgi:hypothetical protein
MKMWVTEHAREGSPPLVLAEDRPDRQVTLQAFERLLAVRPQPVRSFLGVALSKMNCRLD